MLLKESAQRLRSFKEKEQQLVGLRNSFLLPLDIRRERLLSLVRSADDGPRSMALAASLRDPSLATDIFTRWADPLPEDVNAIVAGFKLALARRPGVKTEDSGNF